MTWQAVARKDFQDAVRSKWLWGLSAVFIGLFAGVAYFVGSDVDEQAKSDAISSAFFGIFSDQVVTLIIPLVALVVAYAAITRERDSGSLKLLLSLPHSRQDVVVGKVVGRGIVVSLPIVVGFLASAIVFLFYGVGLQPLDFLVLLLLTVLLGITFVSIAVGVSAWSPSTLVAGAISVALYFLFTLFWQLFRGSILLLNNKLSLGFSTIELVKYGLFVKYFNPVRAYQTLVATLYVDTTLGARLYQAGAIQQQLITQQLNEVPFYLSDAVVFAQLLFWLLIPIAAGYWRFENADM